MQSLTLSSSELRAAVVAEARTYIGVPWRHQGRSREGIDCVGLVLLAGYSLGLCDYPDDYNYSRRSSDRELIRLARQYGTEVRLGPGGLEALGDGDMVVLRDTAYPQHVGLMATSQGQRTIIHASVAHRMVLEEIINDEDHRLRALTAFKFRALA